jgi:hypothetical protein
MRVHDIKLTMPERFDAPKRLTHKIVRWPGFCDRDHSVRNVLNDKFGSNGPIAKSQMDRSPSNVTTRPSTAIKKLHCTIEPYARAGN